MHIQYKHFYHKVHTSNNNDMQKPNYEITIKQQAAICVIGLKKSKVLKVNTFKAHNYCW